LGVQFLRDIAKKILPKPVLEWYRRRRAVRQYLRSLGYEIYDRTVRLELEDVEGRIAARRDGFYERLVQDVLERTELILQELDRRIEALTARHGNEIRELRSEVRAIRESMSAIGPAAGPKPRPRRASSTGSAKVSTLPTSEPADR
jgi:hypothetical protein